MLNFVFLIFIPARYISRAILYIMGWRLVTEEEKQQLQSHDKVVYIYPHTSLWEFVIGVLYIFAQPDLLSDGYFVMKPQPFEKWYGAILKKGRFIPATRREESGKGFVSKTAALVALKSKAYVFISPEGTRAANEWKTGFYHLAQEMNAKVGIIGLDYELQEPSIKKLYDPQDYSSFEEFKEALMKDMSSIVPLYPSSSGSPVRKYTTTRLINIKRVVSQFPYIIVLLTLLAYLY